jgi:uncharacterized integral membrane protein
MALSRAKVLLSGEERYHLLAIFSFRVYILLEWSNLITCTKGGLVVFYIALLFLILLGGTALVITVQNFPTLMTNEHLLLFTWRLPGIPVLLFYLLGAFLGGLLLYVFSAFAARRDAREIKGLRARIIELEQVRVKAPSGALMTNFVSPVVPIPGFSTTGPLQHWPSPTPTRPNFSTTGPLQQGPPPNNAYPPLSPSSASPLARPLPPLPQQGGSRSPFQR